MQKRSWKQANMAYVVHPWNNENIRNQSQKPAAVIDRRCTGKRHRELIMMMGSHYIPKYDPCKPDGEDAHFFSETAQVLAVADGVGGWAKKGIDSGIYARNLMRNVGNAVDAYGKYPIVDLKRVLEIAFLNTEVEGTSTACILSLDGDVLRAVNLGDSGFMVMRGGKNVYTSPVQQKSFNHPYQMGRRKRPKMAEELEVKIEAGDVVIAGTDGLFDNLFVEEIETAVRDHEEELPEDLARTLASMARQRSQEKIPTPFEVAAYEAGVVHFGGKYDDVTVVVARICCLDAASDRRLSKRRKNHGEKVVARAVPSLKPLSGKIVPTPNFQSASVDEAEVGGKIMDDIRLIVAGRFCLLLLFLMTFVM